MERRRRRPGNPRPLRILFLGPDGVPHVTRWVRFLRTRGHEVRLASVHRIAQDDSCGGVPLVSDMDARPATPERILRATRTARRLARAFVPDICVSYYLTSYGVIGALAGLHPHVCATAGGDVLVDRFDSLRRRVVNRAALALVRRRVDRILAWAPHIRSALEHGGVAHDAVFVQPRGVDLETFAFVPPRVRRPEQPLRILSNRLLKPLYGVDVLVRALALLHDHGVAFTARICGEGPVRSQLEGLVNELGIGACVAFPGSIPAGQMPRELAWTDVYVSTSYTDGASSSLFEAMAVGRFPVVTSLPANQPFVEDGVSGFLFPPGDAAALAERLEAVAADESSRQSGSRWSRQIAEERLDYSRNMKSIESVLQQVAGREERRKAS
jgi:glycosyltransferase involved in cell wall biosynthesis